jgi:hypothetical protein
MRFVLTSLTPNQNKDGGLLALGNRRVATVLLALLCADLLFWAGWVGYYRFRENRIQAILAGEYDPQRACEGDIWTWQADFRVDNPLQIGLVTENGTWVQDVEIPPYRLDGCFTWQHPALVSRATSSMEKTVGAAARGAMMRFEEGLPGYLDERFSGTNKAWETVLDLGHTVFQSGWGGVKTLWETGNPFEAVGEGFRAGYQEKGRVPAEAEARRIDSLLWAPRGLLESGLETHFAEGGPHELALGEHLAGVLTHATGEPLARVQVTLNPAPAARPDAQWSWSADPPQLGAIEKEILGTFLDETVGRGVSGLSRALFGAQGGFIARHLTGFLTSAAGFLVTTIILAKIEEWLVRPSVERDLRAAFSDAVFAWTTAVRHGYIKRMEESLGDLQDSTRLAATENRLFLILQSESVGTESPTGRTRFGQGDSVPGGGELGEGSPAGETDEGELGVW